MKRIVFVTENDNKLEEVRHIVRGYDVEVIKGDNIRKIEVQSHDLKEIVLKAVQHIASVVKPKADTYYVVEDDGLFIEALNGFPGPYSSYVYKTIGLKGVLKLLEGVENRRAYFMSVIGALCPDGEIRVFEGVVHGRILYEARGAHGFGYDPVFIPEGYDKTFAEMTLEEKCRISHRAKSFRLLAEHITSSARG